MIGPFDVNYWNYKDTDVYLKGALTLHTLRNVINNDSIFFDILKTFYEQNKYSIVTTKDFISLVNEKTNSDYNWFFNQYLYSRVCPKLEWDYTYDENTSQYEVKYRWANLTHEFQLPVVLKTENGYKILHPTNQVQTVILSTGGSVTINPNGSYIALKKNKRL